MRAQRCHSALSSAISSTIPTPPALDEPGRARVRLAVAAPVPDRGARRPRRAPPDRRGGRRRPRRARPRRRPARLAAPAAGALLPQPRRRLRVAPAPPPHLVGLRVAALDALLDALAVRGGAGRRRLRRRAVGEGARPGAAPARLHARGRRAARPRRDARQARRGGLRARRPGRGPRAVRGPRRAARHLPGDRGARRPRRAVRRRDRVAALVLDLHPALAGRGASASRSRPPPSSPPSTASWPRSRRSRTPTSAPTSPSCCPSTASATLLDLVPDHADVVVAADEDVEPALRDHWDDVCAAFHDTDAHHLYVAPDAITQALERAQPLRLSSISGSQPLEFRAQAAEFAARSLNEAEPELEKLVRSGYTTRRHLAAARRGRARRLQPAAPAARAGSDGGPAGSSFAEANLRDGFVAPAAEARRDPRAPADPPPRARPSARRARGRGLLRSFTDLRTGDIVVHEDHGLARFAGFDTKTVAGRHARLPRPRVPGHRPGLHAGRPAREDLALRRRRRRAPAALQARRHALGHDEGARPPRRPGARRRAAQPLRRAPPPPRLRLPARLGLAARVRGRLPVPRDARPARGDRAGQGGHGGRAPDGPADLRRRRLRQDRGRAARRLQGRQRRQAGADAGADDDPRPAALRHLHRAPARLPVHDRARLALPPAGRAARGRQALRRGQDRHPDRHAPAALARRAREGPRAADRRRGAALRRQAEGAAAPAAAEGRRDLDERDADPAHAADVARGRARHLRDRDAARGPAAGQDLRRRVRRGARQAGARAREGARRPGVLPAQPRRGHRRDGRAAARAVPGHVVRGRPRADGREAARGAHDGLPARRRPTCSSRPRSSSRASTSRRPTR